MILPKTTIQLILFLIIVFGTFITAFFQPWWIIAVFCFVAALFIGKSTFQSFWCGFIGVSLVWAIVDIHKTMSNNNILANRLIHLLPLPGHWLWLVVLSALVGGIIGGIASMSGYLTQKVFKKDTI